MHQEKVVKKRVAPRTEQLRGHQRVLQTERQINLHGQNVLLHSKAGTIFTGTAITPEKILVTTCGLRPEDAYNARSRIFCWSYLASRLDLYLLRQPGDVVQVLHVRNVAVLQTHHSQNRLFVPRSEIFRAIGDVNHIAGRHKHTAKQIILPLISPLSTRTWLNTDPVKNCTRITNRCFQYGLCRNPFIVRLGVTTATTPHRPLDPPQIKSSPVKSSRH